MGKDRSELASTWAFAFRVLSCRLPRPPYMRHNFLSPPDHSGRSRHQPIPTSWLQLQPRPAPWEWPSSASSTWSQSHEGVRLLCLKQQASASALPGAQLLKSSRAQWAARIPERYDKLVTATALAPHHGRRPQSVSPNVGVCLLRLTQQARNSAACPDQRAGRVPSQQSPRAGGVVRWVRVIVAGRKREFAAIRYLTPLHSCTSGLVLEVLKVIIHHNEEPGFKAGEGRTFHRITTRALEDTTKATKMESGLRSLNALPAKERWTPAERSRSLRWQERTELIGSRRELASSVASAAYGGPCRSQPSCAMAVAYFVPGQTVRPDLQTQRQPRFESVPLAGTLQSNAATRGTMRTPMQ